MSALRAELKSWIGRAADGEQVVITERGIPVARLVPVQGADLLAELERDGLLSAPTKQRPALEPRPSPVAPSGVSGLVRRLRR